MDADNPIVRLCTQGMKAESEGRAEKAAELFMEAWERSEDDYERCISAHYLARHQPSPELTYAWNARALELADACEKDCVREFYPSLYLNMGHSFEETGDSEGARAFYVQARDCLVELTDGPYAELVRGGVVAALARLDDASAGGDPSA